MSKSTNWELRSISRTSHDTYRRLRAQDKKCGPTRAIDGDIFELLNSRSVSMWRQRRQRYRGPGSVGNRFLAWRMIHFVLLGRLPPRRCLDAGTGELQYLLYSDKIRRPSACWLEEVGVRLEMGVKSPSSEVCKVTEQFLLTL